MTWVRANYDRLAVFVAALFLFASSLWIIKSAWQFRDSLTPQLCAKLAAALAAKNRPALAGGRRLVADRAVSRLGVRGAAAVAALGMRLGEHVRRLQGRPGRRPEDGPATAVIAVACGLSPR